ncbi:MAG: leucine-rich repeat domain-containing protein, partial [Clostridiales bacterium]|nr:leucine-rich repeat domain-containing protein [Clostridiales bacterium]
MKRIISLLLIALLFVSLAACAAQPAEQSWQTVQPTQPSEQTASPQETDTPEPEKVVVFADPALEAMVRGAIGKPEGAITLAEAEAVTRLDVSFDWQQYVADAKPIEEISGLENFKNLESLDLSQNAIADITPLAGLTKLTLLVLDGNPVADIAPLGALTNLKVLAMSGCAAQDYSPLANLTGLECLMLKNSTLYDASPLAGLKSLKRLYLEGCSLSYSPLADIYDNLEEKDFIIASTLADLGFYMDPGIKQACYDDEQVSVHINHGEWGEPNVEWGLNCVRTVFMADSYKADIGYYPIHDVYVVMASNEEGGALNYLFFVADGGFGFGIGDRASSERHIRAIFPDADSEDLLLAPIEFHAAALEDIFGMTAAELFELPYSPPSLTSLGFVESEEVSGYLYVHNGAGDYFDLSIHDPKQEAWESGGEVCFFMPLSEEYRIAVTYHVNEKRFAVGADDNGGGGAKYDYFIDSDKHIDEWCSDRNMTVEQYFMKAINDPSITETADVYKYSVKR